MGAAVEAMAVVGVAVAGQAQALVVGPPAAAPARCASPKFQSGTAAGGAEIAALPGPWVEAPSCSYQGLLSTAPFSNYINSHALWSKAGDGK